MLPNNQHLANTTIRPALVCTLLWMLCLSFVAITGCKVGPDYKKPQIPLPDSWTDPIPSGTATDSGTTANIPNLAQWWTGFGDPNLVGLIERAIESNLDIRQAQARIFQARAAGGIVSANLLPSVNLSAAATRNRSTTGAIGNLYQTGLDASWEMDIFGGTRRDIEAARADIQASIENYRSVLVTLAAEVALNYIDLRSYQQRIVIAENNLQSQRHTTELTRRRFIGGFAGSLDVANAEAQVAATASEVPLLELAARQKIYNLGILLGLEPAALLNELSGNTSIPPAPPTVPTGIPSDLLRQRPDIRRAQAQLHAATARIGVAEADLFPKFSISGSGGFSNSNFDSLTEWKNRFWSIGPSVTWPIFDLVAVNSNIKLQQALQQDYLIAYQKTILTAMQEVENALFASAKEQEHRKILTEAVTANRKAVELATKLYTEGETDFLNVLQAQRNLYNTEDALVQSTGTVCADMVALYKALGGGWSER